MKTPETIMTIRETCTYQCVLSSTKRCAAVMWLDGSTPATSAVVPKITQIQPMMVIESGRFFISKSTGLINRALQAPQVPVSAQRDAEQRSELSPGRGKDLKRQSCSILNRWFREAINRERNRKADTKHVD